MNDNEIKKVFLLDTIDSGHDIHRFERRKIITQYQKNPENLETIRYIFTRYTDSMGISETLYRIAKNMETRPVCKNCGNTVQFQGLTGGFKDFCCDKCRYEYRSKQMRIHPKKEKHAENVKDNINDKTIIDVFITNKTNRETANIVNAYISYELHGVVTKRSSINMNIYNYLKARYNDSESIGETIYRVSHNIDVKPSCPVCGKILPFINLSSGYRKVCSRECYLKQKSIEKETNNAVKNEIYEQQFNKKYSDISGHSVNDNDIERIFYNNKSKEEQELIRTAYIRQSEEHMLSKKHIVYGDVIEYIKKRYNDSLSIAETLYRIHNHIDVRPVCKICGKPVNFVNKKDRAFAMYCSDKCRYEDNKDNLLTAYNPAETSNAEIKLLEIFNEIFDCEIITSNKSAKDEYKDARYPYKYDFYIKDVDLFIEHQGFFVHGRHPFRNTQEDYEYLNKTMSRLDNGRANKLKYVWTHNDIEKRRVAKQNNLNYLELWPNDLGKKRLAILKDGLKEMKGKSKEEIQKIIKRISLYETIYDDNIYLGEESL